MIIGFVPSVFQNIFKMGGKRGGGENPPQTPPRGNWILVLILKPY